MNSTGNDVDGLNQDDYEINFEINGVLPSLDIVYESAREKVKQTQLPLTVGPMTFLSFGNLPEDNDLLDTYHSEHYLYPIGFKSLREYWDVENPFEKCVYANEIKDGGESGPIFVVSKPDNPDVCFESSSSSGAWKALLEQLSITKEQIGDASNNTGLAVSGPDMYGMSRPEIICLMQGLKNANLCRKYQFRRVIVHFVKEGIQRYVGKYGSVVVGDLVPGMIDDGAAMVKAIKRYLQLLVKSTSCVVKY